MVSAKYSLSGLPPLSESCRVHTKLTMADGLGMIKDVFDAAGTLGLAVGRLELQQDVSATCPS